MAEQFQIHGLVTLELSFDAIGWRRTHALRIVAFLQLVAQYKTVRSRIGVTAATACVRNFHALGCARYLVEVLTV